ncbi:hypothetical protein GS597_16960 [Synechococcales cyanobacterium C]|uniref:Peptidase C-terminal archaeal/bacterial domain-containing protein n=1 Tax=Petrachloros mirabilis ULC683 TaxID=2781853 RepID=A0A8K2A272_9CYAN|nr:hypothetical protein [Petrachloros mirabilis]NCJ08167.1 hypothetical protein [Petrachloros mirabilis ULC683]
MGSQVWNTINRVGRVKSWPFGMACTALALMVAPVQAETIAINQSNLPTLRGFTRGAVALHRIVAHRDVNNTLCVGFGAPNPDHVIQLEQGFPRLQVQVNSRGHDSTLLVRGPDGTVYCADEGVSGGQEAGLVLTNLKPGAYEVWVGSFESGGNFRYSLSLSN